MRYALLLAVVALALLAFLYRGDISSRFAGEGGTIKMPGVEGAGNLGKTIGDSIRKSGKRFDW